MCLFEAAYVSVTVGFSPVTPGNSMVSGSVGAAAGAEGESALGFVDALLGMLTQSLGVGQQTVGETGTGAAADPQAPNLADIGLAVDAAIKGDLPTDPEDGEKLLDDLVAALAAIDDAAESGQPVDPALQKKLSETLDEIAGMLGIALPPPPAIDPTITAAAGTTVTAPDIEIDAGLTMESKPLPPGYELPLDGGAAKPDTKLADDFLKAVEGLTTPVIGEEEEVKDKKAEGAAPDDKAKGTEPETRIDRLVARLTEVAQKLAERLPEVSAKLEALALKMSTKALDAETLVKLEASLAQGDIDALLAPKPEAGKPAAPAPSLFTAPTLPTPAVAALPPKQTTGAPKETEPVAPAEPQLAEPDNKPVAKDTKPAERSDADPKVRDRGSFAAHLADARNEKLADQAQTQPTAATPVKTDIGVVTPKSVHAAYQAPVQQLNMPQVAFEVVRQFSQGASRFQIRLDPPELGRIDVRMQVDGAGNVHARMTVERAETLDLMQRDQRSLEKALAQAGLDSGKTSLEFSLRQNPFARDGQAQQQQQGGHNPFLRDTRTGADEAPEIATTTTQYRGTASASGVNLFV